MKPVDLKQSWVFTNISSHSGLIFTIDMEHISLHFVGRLIQILGEHNHMVQHHVVVKLCVTNFDNMWICSFISRNSYYISVIPFFFGYVIFRILVE